jgi:hypothetical protein
VQAQSIGYYISRGRIYFNWSRNWHGGDDGGYEITFGGIVNRLSIHVGPFKFIRYHIFGGVSDENWNWKSVNVQFTIMRSDHSVIKQVWMGSFSGDDVIYDLDVSGINEFIFVSVIGYQSYAGKPARDTHEIYIDQIEFLN